jgi:tetrapyrrole methylase family protein/MazG family protein
MGKKPSEQKSASEAFQNLLEIMATLRGPRGCPWDKKQTHASLKACLLEETYEVLEAIDSGDPQSLREELGDLLLQVVFQSQIATEEKKFQITEVIHHLVDKLVRRHPHVFADEEVEHADEAIGKWEKIKSQEKGKGKSLLSGVPHELPALFRAYRIGSKVARVGFDWPHLDGVLEKVEEEIEELRHAHRQNDPQALEEELGDLFFSLAQVARHLKVNPEDSLRKSTNKFQKRFAWMEKQLEVQSKTLHDLSLDEMEGLWQKSKSFTKYV